MGEAVNGGRYWERQLMEGSIGIGSYRRGSIVGLELLRLINPPVLVAWVKSFALDKSPHSSSYSSIEHTVAHKDSHALVGVRN